MSLYKLPLLLQASCRAFIGLLATAMLAGASAIAAPGALDASFGNAGRMVATSYNGYDSAHGLALQADDKSVMVGSCFDATRSVMCASRFLSNGQPDAAFGSGGRVMLRLGVTASVATSVAIQTDGRIVIGGRCAPISALEFCVIRLLSSGALDPDFGSGGMVSTDIDASEETLNRVRLLRDGKILAAGTCGLGLGGTMPPRICLARYTADGAPDTAFGTQGSVTVEIPNGSSGADAVELSDGKLLIGGNCSDGLYGRFCVSRLLTNGALDPAFGVNGSSMVVMGQAGSVEEVYSITLGDGELPVLGGSCRWDNVFRFCLARFTANGSLDASFGDGGRIRTLIGPAGSVPLGLTAQDNGKIVALGNCAGSPGNDFCVARYSNDGSLDATFGNAGTVVAAIGTAADWGRRVAIQSDGKLLAAGHCENSAGRQFCAARFDGDAFPATDCALNADGNRVTGAATDGQLALRFLAGLRGNALTAGALGANAQRAGVGLEAHLATLDLDADGDGQALATTDGLLILRAMLGLTGDALTAGATNASHPNVRNAQQILSWIETTHGVACLP